MAYVHEGVEATALQQASKLFLKEAVGLDMEIKELERRKKEIMTLKAVVDGMWREEA